MSLLSLTVPQSWCAPPLCWNIDGFLSKQPWMWGTADVPKLRSGRGVLIWHCNACKVVYLNYAKIKVIVGFREKLKWFSSWMSLSVELLGFQTSPAFWNKQTVFVWISMGSWTSFCWNRGLDVQCVNCLLVFVCVSVFVCLCVRVWSMSFQYVLWIGCVSSVWYLQVTDANLHIYTCVLTQLFAVIFCRFLDTLSYLFSLFDWTIIYFNLLLF